MAILILLALREILFYLDYIVTMPFGFSARHCFDWVESHKKYPCWKLQAKVPNSRLFPSYE